MRNSIQLVQASRGFFIILGIALIFPCFAMAELKDENLIQTQPEKYKIVFQTIKGNMVIEEMVPENESVENWTEMLTTQIFKGAKNADARGFEEGMKQKWLATCKDSTVATTVTNTENGYPTAFWVMHCPMNASTGKPEHTYFKTIKGNDSFYVIQKAFKFEPSKEQLMFWVQYMKNIIVCDTRLADQKCPNLENIGFKENPL